VTDPDNLRSRIRSLGIAKIAREADVPATTLYSFCQSEDRQLGMRTYMRVGIAVEQLENAQVGDGDGGGPDGSRHPIFVDVPVFDQARGYSAQFSASRKPKIAAQIDKWVFHDSWLRTLTDKAEPVVAVLNVSSNELAPTLMRGDQAMIDLRAKFQEGGSAVYLLNIDDRLVFANCRIVVRRENFAIDYKTSPKPPVSLTRLRQSTMIGRVVWVGRTLRRG